MQYDSVTSLADADDVWEARSSWVLPSLHRSSRRVLSDVGRAAKYATGGMFRPQHGSSHGRRSSFLDGLRTRCQSLPSGIQDGSTESLTSSDEPFSLLRMSRNEKLTLLCLGVVDLFSYLCMSIMAPFFPGKVESVGASQTVSGLVFAVYALSVFLSSPIFAKLVPVLGAKFTFVAGVFVAGGCNILFGLLEDVNEPTTFTVLAVVIRIFEGAGAGAFCTASFTILAYEFAGNVAVVFGTLEAFVGLGMTIGPAIGGFLYSVGGFRLPFFVVGSMMLLTVPLNMWLLPVHRHVVTKPKKGSQAKFFKNPSVYIVCFTILVIASVWGFLDPTLEPHLLPFNLSSAMIGLLFLLLSATYAIFSPIWGWIAEKMDNTDILMVLGLIISGTALLFIGPAPFLVPFLGDLLWLNIVCLAVLGAAISMALIPTFESLLFASEEAGMEENIGTYALVSGVWGSAYSLGEVVGPALGGFLDDMYQFPICSTIMAVLCLVTALLFGIFMVVRGVLERMRKKETAVLARKAAMASWRVTSRRDGIGRQLSYPGARLDEDSILTGSLPYDRDYGAFSGMGAIDENAYVAIANSDDIPSIAVSV